MIRVGHQLSNANRQKLQTYRCKHDLRMTFLLIVACRTPSPTLETSVMQCFALLGSTVSHAIN